MKTPLVALVITALLLMGMGTALSPSSNKARPSHKPTPTPTVTPTPTAPPTSLTDFASVLFGLSNPTRDTDAAVAARLSGIRIVNFLEESSTGNAFDSTRWAQVDALVAAAKSRGLKVLLDLSTYRNQLLKKGINPYTADWGSFLTFVGNRYANESAIVQYSLAGEPEPPNGSNPARPTTAQLNTFYQTWIPYLKQLTSAKVTSGGLLQLDWNSGIDWQAIFRASDLAQVHVYGTGDEGFLPTAKSYAQSIGKSFQLEEFGKPQSFGDQQRADYFTRIYGLSTGLVGFWNLGPEVTSESHDVNVNTPLTWSAVQAQ